MKKLLLTLTMCCAAMAAWAQYHLSGDFNGFSTTANLLSTRGGASTIRLNTLNGANNFKIGYNTWSIDWSKGSGVTINTAETWFQPNGGNSSFTFTNGRYYTFNLASVSGAGGNKPAAVLETTYNPASVVSSSQTAPTRNCGAAVVSVTLSGTPASGENVYIRYTTDGYSTSFLSPVYFAAGASSGVGYIPGFNSAVNVQYYIYTSNLSIATINASVGSLGQSVHDVVALNIGAGGSYTQVTTPTTFAGTYYIPNNNLAQQGGRCYTTLTSFVNGLNAGTVAGPITCIVDNGYTETVTAGGMAVTTTGSSVANPVTFMRASAVTATYGASPLLTASAAQTASSIMDAVVKIIGSDYITFDGIDVQENSGNTTVASNNKTEFGYALLQNSTTDGCQNVTIRNCAINMGTTVYQNSFGIYSSSTHTATSGTGASLATTASGMNSNSLFSAVTITNAVYGINILTPPITATLGGMNTTITNCNITFIANTSGNATSSYNTMSITTRGAGIDVRNGTGFTMTGNTISSSNAVTTNAAYGIFITSGTTPSGVTLANTYSSNTITLVNAANGLVTHGIDVSGIVLASVSVTANSNVIYLGANSGGTNIAAMFGINLGGASAACTANGNNITIAQSQGTGFTSSGQLNGIVIGGSAGSSTQADGNTIEIRQVAGGSGNFVGSAVNFINANAACANISITNNTCRTGAGALLGTGITQGIVHTNTYTNSVNVNNNNININRTATGSSQFIGIYSNGSTAITSNYNVNGNTVTLVNGASTGETSGIGSNDGGSPIKTYNANVINISGTGTLIYGIRNTTGTALLTNNTVTVTSSNTAAAITAYGLRITTGTNSILSGNTIQVSSTGVSTQLNIVSGIFVGGSTSPSISNNKIYNISNSSSNTSAQAVGINISTVTTGATIFNNMISGVSAPNGTQTSAALGINLAATVVTYSVYHNTIVMGKAATLTGGTNFGAACILYPNSASTPLDLRNNILWIDATPNGTGFVAALRCTGGTHGTAPVTGNYANTSNNNIFYSPTGANKFLYAEGGAAASVINGYHTTTVTGGSTSITQDANFNTGCSLYKTFMAGRDAASFNENISVTEVSGKLTTAPALSYAESGAVATAITGDDTDFDGVARTSGPDIGALQFAGTVIDGAAPAITLASITSVNCTTAPTISATITDNVSINTTAGTKPRMWYRKATNTNALPANNTNATNGWKFVEASNATSPFTFTFDYSLLNGGTPVAGDAIQYFVVAQDNNGTPNVGTAAGTYPSGFCPATVALASGAFAYTATNSYTITANAVNITTTASVNPVCAGSTTTLASVVGGPTTLTYGAGALTSSGAAFSPFNGTYGGMKTQFLYTSAELVALGLRAGNINSLGIDISTLGATLPGLVIQMGTTSLIDFTATPNLQGGLTTVYGSTAVTYTPSLGVNTFALSPAFNWNGTSNIIFSLSWSTGNTSNGSSTIRYDATTNYASQSYRKDSETAANMLAFTGATGSGTNSLTSSLGRPKFLIAGTGTVTNAYTHTWSNSAGTGATVTPTVSSSTNYVVTAVDANGCSFTSSALAVTATALPAAPTASHSNQCGSGTPACSVTGVGSTFAWYTTATGGTALSGQTAATLSSYSITATTVFYVSEVSGTCQSPRTAVTATVSSPPTFSIASGATVCNNEYTAISVTSTVGDYTNYTWAAPTASLYTDLSGTAYTNQNVSVVYFRTTTAGVQAVTATANHTVTYCASTANVSVTTLPATLNTATSAASNFCLSGSTTVSVPSFPTGALGQWQSSTDNITFSDIANATTTSVSTGTITTTTFYRLQLQKSAGVSCTNSNVVTVTVNNPSVTSATGATICGTGVVTLNAAPSAGSTIAWYASVTGGTALTTTNSYSPNVTATTVFYTAAEKAGLSTTSAIGAGGSTSSSAPVSPFNGTYGGQKTQFIYTQSQLLAAGLSAGRISSVAFNVTAGTGTYPGFSIQVGNTALSQFASANIQGGLTTVRNPASYTTSVGLNTLSFDNGDFYWDGSSNIIVSINWSTGLTSATAATIQSDVVAGGVNVSQSYRKDSETAANLLAFTGATGAGTSTFDVSTSRPRITFGFTPVCASTRTAVTATVNTAPAITVGASPATICNGSSTTLTASSSNANYTYSWNNSLGAGASKTASPSANTTYTVTATDASGTGTANGCVTTGSVAVSVNSVPVAPTITPSSAAICIGAVQTLTAASSSFPSTSVTFSESFNSAFGTFTVVASSSSNNQNWNDRPNGYTSNNTTPVTVTGSTGRFMFANSDIGGSLATTNTQLVSPNISTVGYTSLSVTFMEYLRNTTDIAAAIEISSDNFVTSTVLRNDITNTIGTATAFNATTLAIPSNFNNLASVKIRFRYEGSYDWYWAVDEVKVVGVPQTSNIVWTPQSTLYNNGAASVAYTGTNSSVVYAQPTSTTSYAAIATLPNGCTASSAVNVTVNPTPSLTVTTAPGCAQSTGSVSGANTYTWSGGLGSTANVTATTSGNYFVTGTSTAGCTAVSSGNFDARPLPTTPTVTLSSNTVCAGNNITVTGSGAFMYEFFQNNTTLGATTTNNTVTSTPINGDVWKTRSYNGLSINGNFNDNEWGAPFATSTGGATTGFGANRLDAFYFKSDPTNLNFGLAGNLDASNAILMFIDCKSGGFNSLSSWTTRSAATFGNNYYSLSNLNSGIAFDAGFEADYCLAINGTAGTYYFDIYDMQANTNNYVGTTGNPGFSFQANTAEGDVTKGFEFFIPRSFLSNPTSLKTFTMLANKPAVTDPTFLSNEFLTTANSGEGNYGNGAVNFAAAAPNPINVSSAYVALSCFAESAPVTVTVNPNPTVTVSGTTPACVSTTLTAAGATTYAWSTGSNVAAQNFTTAGTTSYTVTGTSLGCTGTASGSALVYAAPTVTATSDFSTINCTNPVAAVTLTGATTYAWSNGSNSGTGSPYNVTQTQGGTYTVTGTSTDGCTGTVSSAIAENFSAPSLVVNPTSVTITCSVPTETITASGATSYAWTDGQTSAAATFAIAGTYNVTGTGSNGCTATSTAAVAADQAAPTVTLSGTSPACGTVTLTANGANSYAWSTGGNTDTENFTTGGVNAFTVTGTGTNGCTASANGSADVRNSGANVTLSDAGDNANIMQEECQEGNWTYYGDPDGAEAGKYYFAINWAPDGSLDAANAAAKSEAQVQILLNSGQYGVTAGAGATAQGTWVMPRSWNVGNVTTTITEPVSIRFFYNSSEYNAVTTSAANFASANSGARLEPITWFKTVGIPYNPSDFSNTVTFNATAVYDNASIPLPVSNSGVVNNVPYVEFANIVSFSGGSLSTGVGQGNPLPIKLEYFRGEKNGEQSDLTWRTQTETNNSHFIVERSLDGRDFRSVGQVQGAGNSASPINYAFTDENPVPGNNYYRLRQVDFNGASEFSNVVVLNFEKPFAVNAYPNPFNSTFTVDVYTTEEAEGKLEVFDISGRLLDVRNLNLGVGMNRKEVDASLWTPGAYLIKVTAGGNVTQRTMVKTQF